MKIVIDRDKCMGSGNCSFHAPNTFDLDDAIFYTDSHTDLPLLERVREAVCVNPDRKLRRVAERKGWRIERW